MFNTDGYTAPTELRLLAIDTTNRSQNIQSLELKRPIIQINF